MNSLSCNRVMLCITKGVNEKLIKHVWYLNHVERTVAFGSCVNIFLCLIFQDYGNISTFSVKIRLFSLAAKQTQNNWQHVAMYRYSLRYAVA